MLLGKADPGPLGWVQEEHQHLSTWGLSAVIPLQRPCRDVPTRTCAVAAARDAGSPGWQRVLACLQKTRESLLPGGQAGAGETRRRGPHPALFGL